MHLFKDLPPCFLALLIIMEVVPRSHQIANLSAPFLAKVFSPSLTHTGSKNTRSIRRCGMSYKNNAFHLPSLEWQRNAHLCTDAAGAVERKSESDVYKAMMVPN